MAQDDERRPNGNRDREASFDSLIASLDRPVEQRLLRGGYSQLSEFFQRSASRR